MSRGCDQQLWNSTTVFMDITIWAWLYIWYQRTHNKLATLKFGNHPFLGAPPKHPELPVKHEKYCSPKVNVNPFFKYPNDVWTDPNAAIQNSYTGLFAGSCRLRDAIDCMAFQVLSMIRCITGGTGTSN